MTTSSQQGKSLPPLRHSIEIMARHRMEPLHQGETGLCGLFGTLNAIRLALAELAPLTKARSKALFAAGVEYLHRREILITAIVEGIDPQRRNALARHLAKLVSTTNLQVIIERPDHSKWTSIDDVFAWIERSLAGEMPVLFTLTGGLEHHTVIAGSTAKALQLFDSSGHQFVRKSSCGLREGYYQLPPNGLCRIAVHRPR